MRENGGTIEVINQPRLVGNVLRAGGRVTYLDTRTGFNIGLESCRTLQRRLTLL